MRKINVTFLIDDSDQVEHQFKTAIESLAGNSIIDYMIFPNTDHLKDNDTFKKLLSLKKSAGKALDNFINNNR